LNKATELRALIETIPANVTRACGRDGQEIIGERSCGACKLKGHYSTTCPQNPNRSHAIEKKAPSRGGVRKRGRPRTKRCKYEESREELMCEDNESTEDGEFYDSDS
jgi:hypothetical protein